nr:hypothetical protein GCM10020093_040230 [Planobispora longispora]
MAAAPVGRPRGAALALATAVAGAFAWADDGPPDPAGTVFAVDGLRPAADAEAPDRLTLAPLTAPPPRTSLLSVRMRVHEMGEGGRAGFSCRSGPGGRDGYDLSVRGDGGAEIVKVSGGTRVSRLAAAGREPERRPYGPGRAVALTAVCLTEPRRTLLTLWVDGERVADAVDDASPFPVTAVGVTAGRSPDEKTPTRADFRDFRLSRF